MCKGAKFHAKISKEKSSLISIQTFGKAKTVGTLFFNASTLFFGCTLDAEIYRIKIGDIYWQPHVMLKQHQISLLVQKCDLIFCRMRTLKEDDCCVTIILQKKNQG